MKRALKYILFFSLVGCVSNTSKFIDINYSINKVKYKKDIHDEWKKPEVFLKEGGDCEDYAIAKWKEFVHEGADPHQLRLLYVTKKGVKGSAHMVLADFSEEDPIIYDSNTNYIYKLSETRYVPTYSLNKEQVWLFTDEKWAPIHSYNTLSKFNNALK